MEREKGLTFCRPALKGKGLAMRTSKRYCSCGFKVRGQFHFQGKHHKTGKTEK